MRETKVVKFGGSSLADAKQFKKVADIILADPTRRFVVASAPGKRYLEDIKVTDMLYRCYELASEGEEFDEEFEAIKTRYNDIIFGIIISKIHNAGCSARNKSSARCPSSASIT